MGGGDGQKNQKPRSEIVDVDVDIDVDDAIRKESETGDRKKEASPLGLECGDGVRRVVEWRTYAAEEVQKGSLWDVA